MLKFIKEMLSDRGGVSNRRVLAWVITLSLCTTLFLSPSEYIIYGLVAIDMSLIGATTATTYFKKKFGKDEKTPPSQ